MDEEMLIWTSYRYCIGRETYVNSLAPYIGNKYYNRMSDDMAEKMAQDIRNCIGDCLILNFSYDGNVSRSERDALNDFIIYLNEYVNGAEDLKDIDTITCYKDSYSSTQKSISHQNQIEYLYQYMSIN